MGLWAYLLSQEADALKPGPVENFDAGEAKALRNGQHPNANFVVEGENNHRELMLRKSCINGVLQAALPCSRRVR